MPTFMTIFHIAFIACDTTFLTYTIAFTRIAPHTISIRQIIVYFEKVAFLARFINYMFQDIVSPGYSLHSSYSFSNI